VTQLYTKSKLYSPYVPVKDDIQHLKLNKELQKNRKFEIPIYFINTIFIIATECTI